MDGVRSRSTIRSNAPQHRTHPNLQKKPARTAALPWTPRLDQFLARFALVVLFFAVIIGFSHWAVFHTPVPQLENSPTAIFSEGRAMRHVEALAGARTTREIGSPGLLRGERWIIEQLQALIADKGPDVTADMEVAQVSGSFAAPFLNSKLALVYSNLTNIVLRLAPVSSSADDPAVLINAHLDGPLGSPGAADCASCCAVALEAARTLLASRLPLSAPLIFLFNGGEEAFSHAAHGFLTTHKWRHPIGAVINLEANGAGGPDLILQQGGGWPMRVYAEAAVHPRAFSLVQDVFSSGVVPGDTDFRIFARDAGSIPGLDFVLLLDGFAYHTRFDTPDRIRPGVLQAWGENVVALVRGFAAAPELRAGSQESAAPVHFDVFGLFLISYSKRLGRCLHAAPLLLVLLVPFLATRHSSGMESVGQRLLAVVQAATGIAIGSLLALLFPIVVAIARILIGFLPFSWWAHPGLALLQSAPAAAAGLLVPHVWRHHYGRRTTRGVTTAPSGHGAFPGSDPREVALDWATHWGSVGFAAAVAAALAAIDSSAAYLPFLWAVLSSPALLVSRWAGPPTSLAALAGYLTVLLLPSSYGLYLALLTGHFLTEKLGMSGTWPLPWGPYTADVIIAAFIAFEVVCNLNPVLPALRRWMGQARILRALFYASILGALFSSRQFPYSQRAVKRALIQQTFWTAGTRSLASGVAAKGPDSQVEASELALAAADPLPFPFVLHFAPKLVGFLKLGESEEAVLSPVRHGTWLSLYPVDAMLHQSVAVPRPITVGTTVQAPTLRVVHSEAVYDTGPEAAKAGMDERTEDGRRLYIEVNYRGIYGPWLALNITGPITGWSLNGGRLPDPELRIGAPPAFVVKYSMGTGNSAWNFWAEARGDAPLRVEMAVLDATGGGDLEALLDLLPPWLDGTLLTSYNSVWFI